MGKIPITIALLLSLGMLRAQVFTTSEVLSTAKNDGDLARNQSLQELAQGLKAHDPLIRQISAQLGINGSSLGDTIYGYLRNEDAYRLRVEFNSIFERQKQRRLQAAKVGAIAAENRLLEHEALVERYETLAAYLFLEPRISACKRLDSLLEKEHYILQQMLSTGVQDVKVSKVLDAEEDKNRNTLDLQELENQQALHLHRLQQLAGSVTALDGEDLTDVAAIRARVASLKGVSSLHPALEVKAAKAKMEGMNLDYVNSQNRQIFNYVQAGYQDPLYLERPNKFNTQNNISFRVGLSVPLPANNRYKKATALLDLKEAQNEEAATAEELSESLESQFVKLDMLFREHDALQDRIENSLVKKMLDNPELRRQISPLEIVELEIAQQKLAIAKASNVFEIAVEYVRLLDVSGAAGNSPGVNFLSKSN